MVGRLTITALLLWFGTRLFGHVHLTYWYGMNSFATQPFETTSQLKHLMIYLQLRRVSIWRLNISRHVLLESSCTLM